ncbi:MAG: cell division protein FtsX [Betaproteobacteria bacterium RIFCSPHIGHO2_12_FULL_69_13]|nr:MAG: cell division protein FtsX [Betaproteobacteria bacterium RIFCSPHIGHO2_12_FULL_69_13]OGA67319.1 MAG: cell division protein FtsX [Betaproteobacteria bacterium RIFCSPLOWO2_12_FULL_68_20]
MRYELLVGLRYTRAKRRNRFISVISLISMAGIALGVAVLIVVLSVMNGFQKEVRERILGVASHVEITGLGGTLADWRSVARIATEHPRVLAAAPFVQAQGMLTAGGRARGVVVRGVLPEVEDRVTDIGSKMVSGRLDALSAGAYNIVLGADLSRALGVLPGDKLALIAPQGTVTPAGVIPRLRQFSVAGTFNVGFNEADAGLAIVHLEDAQRLYQLGSRVSGVRLKLDDLFAARSVAREILAKLGPDAFASDWTRSHANLFRAVQIEKRMMFIILTLIIAVAAFNVVSTLVMLVTDKQADIAILRTLGASPGSIMQIFVVHGALIGVVGTLLGVAGGVALGLNVETVVPALENALGFKFLAKDVYLIPDLPSEVQPPDVIGIAVVSLVLSLAATLYPSWRASRVNPAEALRYE